DFWRIFLFSILQTGSASQAPPRWRKGGMALKSLAFLRLGPRIQNWDPLSQRTDIKVRYCFHQNNDDSQCEVAHTHLFRFAPSSARDWSRVEGGAVMRNFYLRDPHGFDGWLKANAVLGSLLAIGMLAMALAAVTTSPKSSNVAGSTSHELSKAAQGRESAG